jgi:hypothetical protein
VKEIRRESKRTAPCRLTLEERFWGRVNKAEPNDCWSWRGAKDGMGYGTLGGDNTETPAHRVSWMIHFGEIPKGMCVLHRCDNPSCVNPNHLFLGTRLDNARDRDAKERGYRG